MKSIKTELDLRIKNNFYLQWLAPIRLIIEHNLFIKIWQSTANASLENAIRESIKK